MNKRSYNEDPLFISPKKLKKDQITTNSKPSHLNFLSIIPAEVLFLIFKLLSKKDIVSWSSLSKYTRIKFSPYVFANIKLSWDFLLQYNVKNLKCTSPYFLYAKNVRITDICASHEWTFQFSTLFEHDFPNLRSLELTTGGSTHFFKYHFNCDNFTSLNLKASTSNLVFSQEHLINFRNLKELELHNYEIEFFEENKQICPHLSIIALNNCNWSYPFELKNFGSTKIKSLSLKYSNSFILSERFRLFLTNPGLMKLETLSIINVEKNLKLTLSVQLTHLIKMIPTLKKLVFLGNIYNETLCTFSKHDLDNCLNYIALNDVKVFYSSFLQEI
ncbi:uncharacterized protein SCDLUD_004046 [Saccharomycodes ludwigii]|uniref:uncharacterized protein n=1 Tax=Saccharomycodes ludwigii TaxID=36035 RepID=UPI001E8A33FD|nr:hypothetical protein SCDLUD_004046 [Saccharomycodes ludwigii]KAH3899758.1 hypothetical protein SCDLUD_004046 [Saccharomycodes ludwigii]